MRQCNFVRSCVLGDGISDDRSLEDVRGDRNLSPKDDICLILRLWDGILTDGCNSSESTGVSSVQLRLVTGEAMPPCQLMRP